MPVAYYNFTGIFYTAFYNVFAVEIVGGQKLPVTDFDFLDPLDTAFYDVLLFDPCFLQFIDSFYQFIKKVLIPNQFQ
ncbi:hypothetical protein BMS3Bbin03_01079 [bacterium BMS3Bbin03]|nr:hypothetical protein BMS3Bbin03_01079 [bacterium BMS3Bbin03]